MILKSSPFDILIEDDETQHFQLSTTILKREYDQLKIMLQQKKKKLIECYENIRVLSKNNIKLTKKLMETNDLYLEIANKYAISQKKIVQLQKQMKIVSIQSKLKSENINKLDDQLIEKIKTLELLELEVARRQMIQEQLSFKYNQLSQKINQQEKIFQKSSQWNKLRVHNEQLQKQQSSAKQYLIQITIQQLSFNLTLEKVGLFDSQQQNLLKDKISKLKQSKDENLSINLLILKQWLSVKNSFVLSTYGVIP